jgi:GR25 family glycosyltransferase involved in LPS biosynthesis
MQYYYINLDRRKERNKHFLSEIKKSKIISSRIKRFSAVDGFQLDIKNISNNILTEKSKSELLDKNKTFGISLTYGAVGCALSHYELYKKCIDANEDFLILEDDVTVDPIIDKYLEDYIDYFKYDLLYFGFHRHSHTELKKVHPLINRITGNVWGTFAYVVTPNFCKYCIEKIFPISIQFDSEISKHINQKKIIAMAFNTNVIQARHLGTDIQGGDGMKLIENIEQDPWTMVFG